MSTPGVVGRKAGVVRVTTADFAGVLADVRSDGTQTEVMRLMPGLDRQLTEMLARDTALTLRPPAPLDSLQSTRGVLTLDRQDASGQRLTYVFGTDGRVQLLEVRGGPRGSLFVQYADYDGQGRWKELNVCRPRYYRVQLTFDGDNP